MLLNVLVHWNYLGTVTQIQNYNNKISIWNDGQLLNDIFIETLNRIHASKPSNPILVDVSFKGGYIDSWGRGTLKIINVSKDANLSEPVFEETDGGFKVTLYNSEGVTEEVKTDYLVLLLRRGCQMKSEGIYKLDKILLQTLYLISSHMLLSV